MIERTESPRSGRSIATVAVLAVILMCSAQDAVAQTIQTHGYFKNLGIATTSIIEGDTRYLNLSRFRLKLISDPLPAVHWELWIDTEALAGSFLTSLDFDIGRSLDRREWIDLDWILVTASQLRVEQRVFRGFATIRAGRTTVTLGRQRIAWGTGFAWNPTDLLNPYNPAAVELGEKTGVDAVHVGYAAGDFSRIEAAFAPGDTSEDMAVAARVSAHVGEYDVSGMGGYFRRDWVVGGDFAGYLGDAGLRGEAAVTFPEFESPYLRFTVALDRSFANDYYGFLEYYFNGLGTTDKDEYDFFEALRTGLFNVARDYLAVAVVKSVTPLLGASVYGLVNIDDGSALLGPSLTYSLGDNSELGLATYFFVGKGDTEFGQQSHAYFAYLQFYF